MGFNKAHKMAQRLHRERQQPSYRKKLGYLEKKQDYKKRAIDFQQKAERLKKLKNKAIERNPNEFHFHMINSRLVDGVHYEVPKPLDKKVRERSVKKEALLSQYNRQILERRRKEAQEKELAKTKARRPKHIVFNN